LNSKKEILFSFLFAFVSVSIVVVFLKLENPLAQIVITILSLIGAIIFTTIWYLPEGKPLAIGLTLGFFVLPIYRLK
jgi:hypothetical protein